MGIKPLGKKSYGSIGHLPNSRLGPGDHKVMEGQERIATHKPRDKHDKVIIQEKLDGSNVGLARINGQIIPLTRAGYVANTSPFRQHHMFFTWAQERIALFLSLLEDGERLCGEWLIQAHGTRYNLPHEPFVAFDIFDTNNARLPYEEFWHRVNGKVTVPYVVSLGPPMSVGYALEKLGTHGHHGALDPIEGAVWRVERNDKVDFLCKYVKPSKRDGIYLDSISGEYVYNGYRVKAEQKESD